MHKIYSMNLICSRPVLKMSVTVHSERTTHDGVPWPPSWSLTLTRYLQMRLNDALPQYIKMSQILIPVLVH